MEKRIGRWNEREHRMFLIVKIRGLDDKCYLLTRTKTQFRTHHQKWIEHCQKQTLMSYQFVQTPHAWEVKNFPEMTKLKTFELEVQAREKLGFYTNAIRVKNKASEIRPKLMSNVQDFVNLNTLAALAINMNPIKEHFVYRGEYTLCP